MGMIAWAGALKGAGDAAGRGLDNFQRALTAQMLQEGSQNFQREQTKGAQDFTREQADILEKRTRFNIEDTRKYVAAEEQRLHDLKGPREEAALDTRSNLAGKKGEVALKEYEAEKPLARAKGKEAIDSQSALVDDQADLDRKKFDAGKGLRKDTAVEEITNEVTKATMLAENKAWLKAQMILANAKESSASRAQAAKTMFELEQGKDAAKIRDQYVALAGDPNADQAVLQKAREKWAAYAMKPGESEKIDATNAAAGMREAGNEIVRLQAMLQDQIPGTPEYAALARRLGTAESAHEAFTARVKELTGTKIAAARERPKLINPLKSSAPNQEDDEKEAGDFTGQALQKELQRLRDKPTDRGMSHFRSGRQDYTKGARP